MKLKRIYKDDVASSFGYNLMIVLFIVGLVFGIVNFIFIGLASDEHPKDYLEDVTIGYEDDDGYVGDGDWFGWFGDRFEDVANGFASIFGMMMPGSMPIVTRLGWVGEIFALAFTGLCVIGFADIVISLLPW